MADHTPAIRMSADFCLLPPFSIFAQKSRGFVFPFDPVLEKPSRHAPAVQRA